MPSKCRYCGCIKEIDPAVTERASGRSDSEGCNVEDEKLLNWIKCNSFYSEARDKIQNISTKIRDHYEIQLRGGWSSGQHYRQLVNYFAEIDAFLNQNYIVYDGFSEFR